MSIWDSIKKLAGGGGTTVGPGPAPKDSQPQGTPAVSVYGGYVTSTEQSAKLNGSQKYQTYKEILTNTSIVASGTRYFLNILGRSSWKVKPAVDADGNVLDGAQEAADLVESCMGDMEIPWGRVVRHGAMYRFFGFSLQEWVAKRRLDGKIGIATLERRPQITIEKWYTDSQGRLDYVEQRDPNNMGKLLPIQRRRLVYLVDDLIDSSPEGMGLLRHLVRHAERLRGFEELEEVGFETDLRGIPVARAPLGRINEDIKAGKLTDAEAVKMLDGVTKFSSGHIRNSKSGMLIDSASYQTSDDAQRPTGEKLYDLELLHGSPVSSADLAKAIARINSEMARVIGVEHLMLGTDGAGSLALGKVKTNDFYMTVESVQGDLKESYQRDYIATICDLNGIAPELRPTLTSEAIQFRDVEAIGATLRDMATAGAVLEPDDPVIGEMRDLMGLSKPTKDSIERSMSEAELGLEAQQAAIDAARANAQNNPPGSGGRDVKPGNRNTSGKKPSRANPPGSKPG